MKTKKRKVKMAVLYVRLPDKLHTQVWESSLKSGKSMSKEAIDLMQKALTTHNH